MKKYEEILHTSDIGIKVYGRTKKELFKNAAEGMFDLIVEKKGIEPKKIVRFNIKAPDIKELFVYWLRELLYQYSARAIVFKKIVISDFKDTRITASVSGEKFDPKRHVFKNDIKAVTYHGLEIKKVKNGWQTQVIFDV